MKRVVLLVGILVLTALPLKAQMDPSGFEDGFIPYNSYNSSNFDSVNLNYGTVVLHIPLVSYPQRGTLPSLSLSVLYNTVTWGIVCSYPYSILSCTDVYFFNGQEDTTSGYPAAIRDGTYSWTGTDVALVAVGSSGDAHTMGYLSNGTMLANDGSGITAGNEEGVTDSNGILLGTGLTRDPNGNQITTILSGVDGYPTGWTDSVGRYIPNFPLVLLNQTPSCYSRSYPVPGTNQTAPYQLCYSGWSISTDFSPETYGAYGTGYSGTWTLLTSIILPNGSTWNLTYDSIGRLSSVTTPSGGKVSYGYVLNPDIIGQSFLASRTVNATPSDPTQNKTWSYQYVGAPVTVTDPDGNYVVHTFGIGGLETDTKSYDYAGNLLETVDRDYSYVGDLYLAQNGILPKRVTTTWPNGQVSQVCTIYDEDEDTGCANSTANPSTLVSSAPTLVYEGGDTPVQTTYGRPVYRYEYDYGSGAHGALLRETTTQYMWQNNNGFLNANLLSLPSSVTVSNGAGAKVSQSTYNYDEPTNGSVCATPPCGNLTSTTSWLSTNPAASPTTQYAYNDQGMRTETIDPNGNLTRYYYDNTGAYLDEVQYPSTSGASHVERFSYDFNTGLLLSHTDQNGQIASYAYDAMRRPLKVSNPDGGYATYAYNDSTPNPYFIFTRAVTPSQSFVETGTVDGLGREISTVTSVSTSTNPCSAITVSTTYDNEGRAASVTNPYCTSMDSTYGVTYTNYDPLNRVTALVEQDGSDVTTSYAGNCTTVTDEAGKARKSCVDGAGRMTGVWEDPFGLNYETSYQYDALDNLTSVIQSGSRQRTFIYDSLSRLLTSTNPESGTVCYGTLSNGSCEPNGYDANGNLLYKTDARGLTTTYSYDPLNRLTSKTYSSGDPAVSYYYDGISPSACSISGFTYNNPKPLETAMCDGAGSEAMSYDSMGRVATDQRTSNSITNTTAYTYNFDSSISTLTYPTGRMITYAPTTTYSSGAVSQPMSAQDTANNVDYAQLASYNAPGLLSSLTNGVSLISTWYYTNRLQPCRMAVNSSGTAPNACSDSSDVGNVLDLSYSFNAGGSNNGNVIQITNNRIPTRSQTFAYDTLNRLSSAQTTAINSDSPENCWGETYGYDTSGNWGNLLSIGQIGSYTGCTQESGFTFAVNNKNHILNGSGNDVYYDAAGNMLSALGSGSFAFNTENQITNANGTGYVYDGSGRRVEKITSGSPSKLYWYDSGGNVLDETDGSGNLTNEYIYFAGKRIAMRTP